MTTGEILKLIPQQNPFRFIDTIEEATENYVRGSYTFKESEYFYQGHYPGYPITPGCIITEMMAQIGVIPMGIVILDKQFPDIDPSVFKPVLVSSSMDFLAPVMPGEEVFVEARKIYFRFNKLKAEVVATNAQDKVVCKGDISGFFVDQKKI